MLELHADIFGTNGYKIDLSGIRVTLEKTIKEKKLTGKVEMSLTFVGDEEMMKLHQLYMETYEVTDVLSFPLEEKDSFFDGAFHLGDIVICYNQAVKQAAENNRSIQQEIEFLAEHGCRHLLGEHHE